MALTPFEFVVLCLAVYRGARIVSTDDVSDAARGWLTDRFGADAWGVRLIECPFCSSWHLAMVGYAVAVLALGTYSDVGFWEHAIGAWGVAGGASILSALDGKLTE